MSFSDVHPGDPINASNVQQVIDALKGTAGKGVPLSPTAVNNATNYALTVENLEPTNSRALNVLKSDGSTLIKADANGVTLGSPISAPAGSLPGSVLENGSVTTAQIADGTIQTTDIAGGAVGNAQLAPNAVTTDKIADGTIAAVDLSAALGNFGAGASWTPALTQGGATFTLTVNAASYVQIGKLVLVQLSVSVASASGAAPGQILISSVPVPPRYAGGYIACGSFIYERAGVGFYAGTVIMSSSTNLAFMCGGADQTNTIANYLGATQGGGGGGAGFGAAVNDTLTASLVYEAA